jgi:hypothetical protein
MTMGRIYCILILVYALSALWLGSILRHLAFTLGLGIDRVSQANDTTREEPEGGPDTHFRP